MSAYRLRGSVKAVRTAPPIVPEALRQMPELREVGLCQLEGRQPRRTTTFVVTSLSMLLPVFPIGPRDQSTENEARPHKTQTKTKRKRRRNKTRLCFDAPSLPIRRSRRKDPVIPAASAAAVACICCRKPQRLKRNASAIPQQLSHAQGTGGGRGERSEGRDQPVQHLALSRAAHHCKTRIPALASLGLTLISSA